MAVSDENTGVIHGRFQVLHNDHLKYLMAGKELCRHLIVGITNPDPFLTKLEDTDTKRNSSSANPLTYYERYVLVRSVLEEKGLKPRQYSIVPFPINIPELYRYYVPMDALFFLTIYDEWGRRKLNYFQEQGLKTHVLWEVPHEQKGISASDIRDFMITGKSWDHLVPESAAILLNRWHIPERLKKIHNFGLKK